jgi:hypothetical protein
MAVRGPHFCEFTGLLPAVVGQANDVARLREGADSFYVKNADRKRLARAAMALCENAP